MRSIPPQINKTNKETNKETNKLIKPKVADMMDQRSRRSLSAIGWSATFCS